MAKELISIRLEPAEADQVKDLAARDGRTKSNFVRKLITDAIRKPRYNPHAA
jgi:predicted DNA-binding protein